MGRAPVLGGRHSLVQHNNHQRIVSAAGRSFLRRRGRGVWGGLLLVVLGSELSIGKIETRESNGALDFNGFCWMGGSNNQPKVGRNN